MKKALYPAKNISCENVHLTTNSKVGSNVMTINFLPGGNPLIKKDGTVLTDIPGTCDGVCDSCENNGCYAVRDAKFHHNSVLPAVIENTLLLRNNIVELSNQIITALKNDQSIKMIRWHASGEIDSLAHWQMILGIAHIFPDRLFYIYTKRFEIVCPWLDNNNLPKNLILNFSVWHEYGLHEYLKYAHKENVKAFAFVDGQFDYESHGLHIETMCPAYIIDGYYKNGNKRVKRIDGMKCGICKNRCNCKGGFKVCGCIDH